jgi:hypothetical protein
VLLLAVDRLRDVLFDPGKMAVPRISHVAFDYLDGMLNHKPHAIAVYSFAHNDRGITRDGGKATSSPRRNAL